MVHLICQFWLICYLFWKPYFQGFSYVNHNCSKPYDLYLFSYFFFNYQLKSCLNHFDFVPTNTFFELALFQRRYFSNLASNILELLIPLPAAESDKLTTTDVLSEFISCAQFTTARMQVLACLVWNEEGEVGRKELSKEEELHGSGRVLEYELQPNQSNCYRPPPRPAPKSGRAARNTTSTEKRAYKLIQQLLTHQRERKEEEEESCADKNLNSTRKDFVPDP